MEMYFIYQSLSPEEACNSFRSELVINAHPTSYRFKWKKPKNFSYRNLNFNL